MATHTHTQPTTNDKMTNDNLIEIAQAFTADYAAQHDMPELNQAAFNVVPPRGDSASALVSANVPHIAPRGQMAALVRSLSANVTVASEICNTGFVVAIVTLDYKHESSSNGKSTRYRIAIKDYYGEGKKYMGFVSEQVFNNLFSRDMYAAKIREQAQAL